MVIPVDRSAFVCAAAALVCWPAARNATTRLTALHPSARRSKRHGDGIRLRGGRLVALALLPLVPLIGPVGAVSAALLFAAGWHHRRISVRAKAETAAAHAMAEAIGVLVAELRAGAPTELAAECAAADSTGEAAAAMRTLAGTARLGGDLPMRGPGAPDPDRQALAKAWSLSRRHGLPLADLLDAVRRDILATARFVTRVGASMSGPRASAAVLAALPGLGLLLGEAMGAGPVHVLTGTGIGQLMLVTGSVLILTGVAWSARLTNPGALP